MRIKIFTLLTICFCGVFLVSCSRYGAPNCDDKQVVSLAKRAFLNSVKNNKIIEQECAKDLMLQGKVSFLRIPSIEEVREALKSGEGQKEEWLNEFAKCFDLYFKKLQKVKLYAIRVEDKDDKIQKTICKANLKIEGKDFGILTYTAQFTKDNQILVETLWEQ